MELKTAISLYRRGSMPDGMTVNGYIRETVGKVRAIASFLGALLS